MFQDLHSHTYYSFCGKDRPEAIVEAAIDGGLDVFGITDHNYGVGFQRITVFRQPPENFAGQDYGLCLIRYFDHINLIKEKYKDKIKVLRGIELCTLNRENLALPENADISYYDYCLIENLDSKESITGGDIFSYSKHLGCPCGVAHTNLFAHAEHLGIAPYDYFSKMAEAGIFWEMNVSYDSIHNYREHSYMLDFFKDEAKQDIIRRSGVKLSVGFDGHRVEDYLPDRIKNYCTAIENMGIPLVKL